WRWQRAESSGGLGCDRSRAARQWTGSRRAPTRSLVRFRLRRPEARRAFLAGFRRLSPESRYLRFFTPMPRMPASALDRLVHTDGIDHVALSAWRDAGDGPMELIGVARFVRLAGEGDTAAAAIAVVDHMQARGGGRLRRADPRDRAPEPRSPPLRA